jgi:hypothetical protein
MAMEDLTADWPTIEDCRTLGETTITSQSPIQSAILSKISNHQSALINNNPQSAVPNLQ